MSVLARAGVLASLLALGGGAHAEAAPCHAEVILEPQLAFVEQQVVYRLRMLRRAQVAEVRWIDPPSFGSFRAEWLPGRTPDPAIDGVGAHRLVFEERRALFPVRPGRLETPRARMACVVSAPEGSKEVEFRIPSATLEVAEPPQVGRPADWSGVVGRIEVRSTTARTRVPLGESLELGVSVSGPSNVWRVRAPFGDPPRIQHAELFPERPSLSLEAGERLVARRSFRFDLVPRREGPLEIPSVRVPYYDPATGRYAVAEAPAIALVIEAAVESTGSGSGEAAAARRGSEPERALGRWRLRIATGVVLAAALALLAWRRGRPRPTATSSLLARAAQARTRGDRSEEAAFLSAALRAALDGRRADADPEAQALLDALDAERFGRDGPSGPELEQVRRVVERIER